MIHLHVRPEDRNLAANRLKLLSEDLYKQLAEADEATRRRLTAALVNLAFDEAAITTGREDTTKALAAGHYGDTEIRRWLHKTSKDAAMASNEAEELDGNRAEAERTWKLARGYEIAYQALDTDATHAAGEATYQAAILLGQDRVIALARQLLTGQP
jgi:hypothetical protein